MKAYFTLFVFFLALSVGQAQDINTEQSTLLIKKTATWCPFCGQWGWTMMKGIMDDNQDKAIILGAHYSGNLRTPAAEELMSEISAPGQPVFFENRTNLRVSSGNVSSKRSDVKTIVDNNFATTARIGVGVRVEDKGGSYEIKVSTEFLEEVTGDFNVSVLVLENNVQETQSGRSGTQDHPNVIREAVNGVFGESLATGTTAMGQMDEFSYTYTPDASYNAANLRYAVIIWEDQNGSWSFENGFVQDEVEISTSTNVQASAFDFSIQPSILTATSTVSVTTVQNVPANITLFDLLGNEVANIFEGDLTEGRHNFEVLRNDVSQPGMYLISMRAGKEVITKRLLVK